MDEAGAQCSRFGMLPSGEAVTAITLHQPGGLRVTVLSLGATIQAVHVPGSDGRSADVALGHATLASYLAQRQYLGATVGRVANRIAGGGFMLDGTACAVPPNDGPNALHGGPVGFDQANWSVLAVRSGPIPAVRLGHVSPDGDMGFPGALQVTATYVLPAPWELRVDYRARTDRPTLVGLTNHVYWNLAGEGAPCGAMDHRLTLAASRYLPTDATAIPTGETLAVDGTPFDFRCPQIIGARVRDARDPQIRIGRGYDHHWIADPGPRAGSRPLARLEHPASGRVMALFSNMPGLQFYSGNRLDGTSVGKAGQLYRMGDGIALEPQMPPDTANQPAFGTLRLDPGQRYRHTIRWCFSIMRAEGEGPA